MASMLLLVTVFLLDVIAFALAVAAERRRNTASIEKMGSYSYCHYDSDIATGLGVGSMLFLTASHLLIMLGSRCLCCGKALRPSAFRTRAVILFVTCWVLFSIAEVCLLAGSVRNAYHTKYYLSETFPSCRMLRKGVFGAGAAFVLFTAILSGVYYVSYSQAVDAHPPFDHRRDTGLGMGNL